jgi:hypothetical protein
VARRRKPHGERPSNQARTDDPDPHPILRAGFGEHLVVRTFKTHRHIPPQELFI